MSNVDQKIENAANKIESAANKAWEKRSFRIVSKSLSATSAFALVLEAARFPATCYSSLATSLFVLGSV